MQQINVAIVGTGGIAQAHAASYQKLGERVRLVAAAEIDADRLAVFGDAWSVPRLYADVTAMLTDEDLDLVSVCTPPGTHDELALECLRHGVNVLCEKPPALSLAKLDEIIAAEADSTAHFATVFQNRFCAAPEALQRLIGSHGDLLGRPMTAVCQTLWYRPDAYFEPDWRGNWELEGGGPTIGHGIHQMDLMLAMLGDWTDVIAVARRQARPIETEDLSCAIVTFASGAVATVVNSFLSPRETSHLRFDFDNVTAELAPNGAYGDWNLSLSPPPGQEIPADLATAGEVAARELSGHPAQISAVLDALETGVVPPVDSSGARSTLELIAAIYASAFTGRRVGRSEITPGSPFYTRMNGSTSPFPALREVAQA